MTETAIGLRVRDDSPRYLRVELRVETWGTSTWCEVVRVLHASDVLAEALPGGDRIHVLTEGGPGWGHREVACEHVEAYVRQQAERAAPTRMPDISPRAPQIKARRR